MRKALVVGLDHYEHVSCLQGCVNDSHRIKALLDFNSDGSRNFAVKHLTATGENNLVKRKELKDAISELFEGESDIALFYFSGHGYVESTGGYLITSECESDEGDSGLKLDDILQIANSSKAKSKVVVLDSCHSGAAGSPANMAEHALLSPGVTILAASGKDQYALEVGGSGVFTNLLADALSGGAANLLGNITPGSVYAHIDQALGPWDQRPIFKTHVNTFINLRRVDPPISLAYLQELPHLFDDPSTEFKLDPSFEPEGTHPKDVENMRKFKILQAYNRVNLLIPIDAPHMWHAAMESKSCQLTALGAHYWNLVKREVL